MKSYWKYFVTIVFPLAGISALLGACASMNACNNDACYDRHISSVDPYKKGEIANWGSEKATAEREEEKARILSPASERAR